MNDITLLTRDGARLGVICPPGETVLAAAEAAGLFLPSMCHEGSCGLCRAEIAGGGHDGGGQPGETITRDVLLCQCRPTSDMTVALPYAGSAILRHRAPTRAAVIERIAPAGASAVSLVLRLLPDTEYGEAADFVPGQYMEVAIPGTGIRRAYSLANLPNWDGRMEFLIRLVPGGAFSTWLGAGAKPGDALSLRGPLGRFTLDDTSPRSRCLVGGGCGLAPLLSMLRHLAEFQDMQETHLMFGANREAELFATAEIADLAARLPALAVTTAIWHPEGDWAGFVGTAAEALGRFLATAANKPDVYVCGPPRLVEAVIATAQLHGVPAAQIRAEAMQFR
ncbi:MAG TPA: 2Fe-2S iron-sulfur cluster binding domain-containing protein [Acidiphilium sp.]|nr:2Fe-2S iron-sulfur cluster binding domain-containing protein [Acidiphilium sp.]